MPASCACAELWLPASAVIADAALLTGHPQWCVATKGQPVTTQHQQQPAIFESTAEVC